MSAGFDRLNRVIVQVDARSQVELSWDGREELLKRAAHLTGGDELRAGFDLVGTTRPVQLDRESKLLALDALEQWLRNVNDAGALPAGVEELRHALANAQARGEL